MQSHARADHLDISRAITVMGEHDLAQATAWMGAALHLLQRDLLVGVLTAEAVNAAEQNTCASGHACPLLRETRPEAAGKVQQN